MIANGNFQYEQKQNLNLSVILSLSATKVLTQEQPIYIIISE